VSRRRGEEDAVTSPPVFGEIVTIPWGIGRVRGTVADVYGSPGRLHVLVELRPELTGAIVDEPTTVAWPLEEVERVDVPA
jgi:hypothetical protein